MTDKSICFLMASSLCMSVCQLAHAEGERLDLASPKGGEQWCVDSKHYIVWNVNANHVNHTMKIEDTTDAGKTWNTIASSAPNKGKFLWTIPNRLSTQCKIRISDRETGQSDESKAPFAIIPSREVPNYKWVNVTNTAGYAPRDGAGALVFNGKMWLLGGWNPGDKAHFPRICNNEVWSSEDGVNWVLVKPNTFIDDKFDSTADWEGRHTAGYAVHDGKMWIVGGDVNQGHYHFDVWSSTDGVKWKYVNKNKKCPWGPRALHYTLVFKDKIWIMGGQTIPQFASGTETIFYNDIWNTSDGVNWTKIAPKAPLWSHRGMIGGSVVFRNKMWILGGGTYDTPTFPKRKFYNDVWSSPDGVNWEQNVLFAPWTPRQYHDVAVFDDRLWVMEGYYKANRNDVWYSSDGVNWYEVPDTPWNPRHAASVLVYKNALWMVAGNNMERDVWKLQRTPVDGA